MKISMPSAPSFARSLLCVAVLSASSVTSVAVALQVPPPPPPQAPGARGQDAGDRPGARGQDGGRQRGEQAGQTDRGGRRGGFGGGPGGPGGRGFGGGGMRDVREALEPDFIRRDVPVFVKQLQLDDMQSTVLETLMNDYEEQYREQAETLQADVQDLGRTIFQSIVTPEMRDRFTEEMRSIQQEIEKAAEEQGGELDEETRRGMFRERMARIQQQLAEERQASGANVEIQKSLSEMFTKLNTWQTKKGEMRQEFVDGLKASLNDDQLALWPAFERFLTREKTLPRGRLSGESTNLILVLDELELSDEEFAKAESVLDPYEIALDSALVARNDFLVSSMPRLFKAIEAGDAKEAQRIFDRQMQLRAVVRDVNEDFRQQIVSAIGESEAGKEFEQEALLDGFERIYRTTLAERSFEAALEMEGIDPDVRTSIAELQAAYLNDLTSRNRDLVGVTKRSEPAQQAEDAGRFATYMAAAISGDFSALGGMGMPFGRGQFSDRAEDPVRDAFDARTKMNDDYVERLRALLTPEQVEQLPRRQGRRGAGGAGGGDGGGAGRGGMTRMLESIPEAQRAEIMAKVDVNKNGEVDDDERGEFFRVMRESGVDIFGRGGDGAGGGDGGRRRNRGAE